MISRFAQTLVVALVMVVQHKFVDGPPHRALAEQNHSFQARLLDGSHQALRVGIEIRRAWRQFHRLHAGGCQYLQEFRSEQGIPVMKQISLTDQEAFPSVPEVPSDLTHPEPIRLPRTPAISTLRLARSLRKSTRNLVKPWRVQASMVKKSAATIPSRGRHRNSFPVVFRSPSGAGSSPCSFRRLAMVPRPTSCPRWARAPWVLW